MMPEVGALEPIGTDVVTKEEQTCREVRSGRLYSCNCVDTCAPGYDQIGSSKLGQPARGMATPGKGYAEGEEMLLTPPRFSLPARHPCFSRWVEVKKVCRLYGWVC